jgi:uroporphyrinogen-III synthase
MKVFISRDWVHGGIFRKILTEKGIELCAESLIDFSPLDFRLPEVFDWIFFYSKKGVEYFFDANPKLSTDVKIAALGTGTASAVLNYSGKEPDFTGDGNPETTADAFKKIALAKKVLFIRALESKKSVQNLLANDISVSELIVYKNVPKKDISESNADILLFTSSLNAEAYLKKYPLKQYQQLAAIGKPTAETLATMGYTQVYCAESPDENALANLILKIFENNKP